MLITCPAHATTIESAEHIEPAVWCEGCLTENRPLTFIAADILEAIHADVEAGTIPATVGSFSELHDYVDANDYLIRDDLPFDAEADLVKINAVTDIVDAAIKRGEWEL